MLKYISTKWFLLNFECFFIFCKKLYKIDYSRGDIFERFYIQNTYADNIASTWLGNFRECISRGEYFFERLVYGGIVDIDCPDICKSVVEPEEDN